MAICCFNKLAVDGCLVKLVKVHMCVLYFKLGPSVCVCVSCEYTHSYSQYTSTVLNCTDIEYDACV